MHVDITVIEDLADDLMKIDSALFLKLTELRELEDKIFAVRQRVNSLMVDGWQKSLEESREFVRQYQAERDAGLPIDDGFDDCTEF